jgi:Xaa-Pro aminopeptidase
MAKAATARSRKKTARRRARKARGPLAARLSRVREELRERDLDALLVSHPPDIRYLTSFRGDDSLLLLTHDKAIVISDFRFEEELAALGRDYDVRIRTRPHAPTIEQIASDLKIDRLALQSDHMTIAGRRRLAKRLGARRLKDVSGLVARCRAVKDEGEIQTIRRAIRIQEKAFDATLEQIGPGMSEREICARLEYEMKRLGSERPSFDPIVAAGPNASLPHAVPGADKTRRGRPLLVDWGAIVDGYASDLTRTISFASWPRELRKVYEIVLEAQQAGIDAVRPGAAARDVDKAARDIIDASGYGPRFGHSLGHGIGLAVHESPRLASTSDDVLAPGMVVTVEPGVYLPGVGGVRIEDDVLVTDRGRRVLSTLPKDIDWATR